MSTIESLDRQLFLLLNSINSPYFDVMMYWVTYKYTWVPLYLILVGLIIKELRIRALVPLLIIGTLILVVDQSVANAIKPFFGRLRPCYNQEISELINLVVPCGGQFSFISGHAANTFALAIFIIRLFPSRKFNWLLMWAAVVSYSRIYVGVHYPSDVVLGAFYGGLIGWIFHEVSTLLSQRIFKPR